MDAFSAGGAGASNFVANAFDPNLTWSDIAWLKRYDRITSYKEWIYFVN